ncbi:PAS domain S-box protein [Roseococcus microcysteis]|uniref:PAS domain S-box protein n=1 Tax=Roseococcus microcysteis TaxID=2771361 RepID=UPI00168BB5C1|nr:PAS domain-containing protein [Roseococcus microcysteis]
MTAATIPVGEVMQERAKRQGRPPPPAPCATPELLRGATEGLRLPVVVLQGGAGASILFANAAFGALSGFTPAELEGRALCGLLGRKGDTSLEEGLTLADTGMPGGPTEYCFRRKDGTTFWAALSITSLPGAEGTPGHRVLAMHDVTSQHQDMDRMRLLLVEMNHRTQNMFSAVVETLTGRVLAFSRAQAMLRDEMDGHITLRQVLGVALQPPTIPRDLSERLVLEGEDVRLPTNVALTTAMALHELAVNAVRHGALSGDDGVVRIQWSVRSPPRGGVLALRWREAGGPRMKPLYEKGFGMRLIEGGVQHGLGGTATLSLEATGLVCDITLPLRVDGRTS